ncbi:MAG: PH domain-containing protein [Lachnospiraceae bacterium]|nr:PH domain-containing protein [Lachnospiraceae bacterium]MEE3461430.1 PH domain-containing protein [Lachnospiraceae bacterium]
MKSLEFRNHPSILLEKGWSIIVVIAAFIFNTISNADDVNNIADFASSHANIIMMILLVIFLPSGIVTFNRWRKTVISLKDGIFTIKRNTFVKKELNIQVKSISNVNLEQNIFENIIGTYRVKIDTASLTRADETDVNIVLNKKNAVKLKDLIFEMQKEEAENEIENEIKNETGNVIGNETENETGDLRSVGKALSVESGPAAKLSHSDAVSDSGDPDLSDELGDDFYYNADVRLDTSQALVAGIMNLPFVSIIALIISAVAAVLNTTSIFADAFNGTFGIGTIFAAAVVFFSALWDIIKKTLGYFGFAAKKKDNRILLSYGLIKKKKYAIPLSKINGYVLESTFPGVIFGYTQVRVLNVGGEGDEAYGQILLPPVMNKYLDELIDILLPSGLIEKEEKSTAMPVSYQVFRTVRNFLTGVLILVICITAGKNLKVSNLPAVFISVSVIIVIFTIWTYLSSRAAGLGIAKSSLVLKSGAFARKKAFIPYERIQSIKTVRSPFERAFGCSRLCVSILSSKIGSTQRINSVNTCLLPEIEEKFRETY